MSSMLARCAPAWWLLTTGLTALGPVGVAAASVVAPPLAATLIAVCRGQPCLAVPPTATPALAQARSRKRVTRLST